MSGKVKISPRSRTFQRRLKSTVYMLSRLSQYVIYWLSHDNNRQSETLKFPSHSGEKRSALQHTRFSAIALGPASVP